MPNLKKNNGQGLVEYILIVVVMGLLAVGAIKTLASSTKNGFTGAASNLDKALQGP